MGCLSYEFHLPHYIDAFLTTLEGKLVHKHQPDGGEPRQTEPVGCYALNVCHILLGSSLDLTVKRIHALKEEFLVLSLIEEITLFTSAILICKPSLVVYVMKDV